MRQLRNHFLNRSRAHEDRVHPVVNEVNLPLAREFLFNRGLDQIGIEMRHHGVNGQAGLSVAFPTPTYRASPAATCAACAESVWRSLLRHPRHAESVSSALYA